MTQTQHQSTEPARAASPRWPQRLHTLILPLLLALTAALAVTSLLGDSITYDETSHLTAGMSYLKTGDFRLAPDHPPLAKMWAAWPLLLLRPEWPPPETYGWGIADVFQVGRAWLFELNDGERLLPIARMMMVLLLLATCLSIYALGRVVFGPAAGLLALVLAALSPTLLAHGRLVTTDLPITLCITLTLLTFARVLQRVTWGRLLACVLALGAASVTKLSWPLVLPALAVMGVAAVVRRTPIAIPARSAQAERAEQSASRLELYRRRHCAGAVVIIAVFLAATTWVSIWSAYRWRISMFPEPSAAERAGGQADPTVEQLAEDVGSAWYRLLHDEDGQPRAGLVPAFLQRTSQWHLLPDAYLFGLAWTLESTSERNAYFCGQHSLTGWFWYFPLALAIKTPLATLALFLAGIAALVARRARCREPVLLIGLLIFAAVHTGYVMSSSFNIGQRHLLPIYPVLLVIAGASAAWLASRAGRALVAAAILWLVGANAWIHPHYLSYFNELIGGPRNGHLYLADSNIDWGQDLKRLAAYAARHPSETIKLSYFGSAVPTKYGFACELLPSSLDTGSPALLDGGGTYVISATHLVGVYDRAAQEEFWQEPSVVEYYRELHDRMSTPALRDAQGSPYEREQAAEFYARLRWGRFLINLRHRPPDERIGYSLFVYRLSSRNIEELTLPQD